MLFQSVSSFQKSKNQGGSRQGQSRTPPPPHQQEHSEGPGLAVATDGAVLNSFFLDLLVHNTRIKGEEERGDIHRGGDAVFTAHK